MEKFLTATQVNNLIKLVNEGNNSAWKQLYENYTNYIHKRAWKKLEKLNMPIDRKKDIEEDLFQAGWVGFVSAVKNVNPDKGKLLAYATKYIDGEISKALGLCLNSLGITDKPKKCISRVSEEDCLTYENSYINSDEEISLPDEPDRGKYSAERRTLQILEVLRLTTDEKHSISKDELGLHLQLYRRAKHKNGTPLESPNTITSTIENMLAELNPMEYTKENNDDYKIRYEGYKENRLKQKLDKKVGKKAPDITNFSYTHIFSYSELDKLIQIISFSDMLSADEKTNLVKKLKDTASVYYKSAFFDGEKLKFNPQAIYGRFSGRYSNDRLTVAENLKTIQWALNNMAQISFKFNCYNSQYEMVPKSDYTHTLSPYHLVVYHDNYYCIGLKKDDKRIWHYRVDLMSDIEIIKNEKGRIIPIEVSAFAGLPIANVYWNPKEYMAEHLNMAYDEPQDIFIKIRDTDYTILHDWFSDYYEKTNKPCEDGFDIVKVKTSPSMIVHWAMQYGTNVEIMNEDIREKIKEELNRMNKMYEKK